MCATKAPHCRKNKVFKGLGHYAAWPKVADAVIKAHWVISLSLAILVAGTAPCIAQGFRDSHALVIGIDRYNGSKKNLSYAVADAQRMAEYLNRHDYKVTLLLNEQATRSAILDEWRNRIRTRLGPDDRILLYFGGHGETEKVRQRNDGTWITDGALVTYGARSFSEMLTVADIHRLSDQLGRARHQLFIINACYGGSLGIPTRGSTVQTTVPGYLAEMTRRPARQFISAGGADQLVMDGGVDGLSFFTHHLLEALGKRYADLDNDGVIILPELTSYLVPRAFNKHQMPAADAMPGHGLGEYVFETLAGPSPSIPSKPTVPISVAHGQLRGEDVQVVERNYEAMRRPIDDLYRALAERDLERYLAQWAEDAIQTGKGKQYSYNDIVAKRSRAFANWEKVEVLRYQISFAGYQENKGQFDARYTMRFTYRSGKEITESDIAERYLVRFDTKQNRWLIAENHDYLNR